MSWRDELQRCSFRGVEFHYEVNREGGGHRNTKHRFVDRSGVAIEEHGLEERHFSFNAYVMGDDVFAQRDALLEALQAGGAGELVLGDGGERVSVKVDNWTIDRSNRVGGSVHFSIEFTEDGTTAGPYEGVATGPAVLEAADQAEEAAAGEFTEALEIFGWPDAVGERFRGELSGAVERLTGLVPDQMWVIATQALDGLESLTTMRASMETLLQDAAAPVLGLVSGYLGLARTTLNVWGPSSATTWLATLPPVSKSVTSTYDTSTTVIARNRSLVSQLETVAAAIAVSELSARRAYEDRGELEAARGETLQILRRGRVVAAAEGHLATYLKLGAVRSSVTADLAARGENLADLIQIDNETAPNTLQLAYELYEDLDRTSDLLMRATTRHPGFLDTSLLVRDQ